MTYAVQQSPSRLTRTRSGRLRCVVTCFAGPLTAALPAMAQSSPSPAALSPSQRSAVVDSVANTVERRYVDADTGRRIAELLRARQRAKAYDSVSNPALLAEQLIADLRRTNSDLHLGVRFVPPDAAPTAGVSALGPGRDPQRINYGLSRVEILEGNIGYLEITSFEGGAFHEAVADALRFLSRTDAIIIDIRRNGGGTSEMSHYVFSHFLPEPPTPTIDVRTRDGSTARRSNTVASVAGPRRTDVPLYLLTSLATGSAAEEFAFVLRNRSRAVTVGSRTAGAGHMVGGAAVGHGFVVSFSTARVTDPATGKEWERTGVAPVIAVDPERALDAAHAASLTQVAASAPASSKRALQLLAEAASARATPVDVGSDLARLQGVYAGGRQVILRDGQLLLRREGLLPQRLIPLGGDRFALGTTRLRFERSGDELTLVVQPLDGTSLRYRRSS